MSTLRQGLITSAVNFLKDPNVQNSPLKKRVAFLESKGLTSEEIEEALRKVKDDDISTKVSDVALPQNNQPNSTSVIIQPPPVPRMDWRDYFIAAVFVGGIGYAIIAVAKKYISPLLRLPTADDLDRDKQLLTDQFTTASETLDTAKHDIQLVKKSIEEQSFKVREALERLDEMLKNLKDHEIKKEAELRNLKDDVDTIRDLIPKLLEKTKESQSQSLNDLQQELKSLKSLLANRRSLSNDILPSSSSPTLTSSATSPIVQSISSLPGITSGRPTIPTWQMGTNNSDSQE
ncbi:peroxisomal membrane anchor protein conserved region-domain-containing protein [Gigaspora margarita]|uniref:Peroxisomal membrane protein PEX14 n=1 Tax=Gigaspora margarita TaxID=4874 RepID=A0A8H3X6W0_GIGMA|nr:peroxisomal membrane anchor protein conserved region-domain-containing protein [Gigaspora margarita]